MSKTWGIYPRQIWDYCFFDDIVNEDEIEQLFKLAENSQKIKAQVSQNKSDEDLNKIRKTSIRWIEPSDDTSWIYKKLTDIVIAANEKYFSFDLDSIQEIQFSEYNVGDFYEKHRDHFAHSFTNPRKLSFVLQLTNPELYEGGSTLLWLDSEPTIISKKKGTITFFPSYTLHEVTEITQGTRHAIVGWVEGKPFK